MIPTNQFKNGLTLKLDGDIYSIESYQHVKPGKGGAFVRTKLRSFKTGNIIERTFRSGEKVEPAFIENTKMQFLYRQGNSYHFMDQETFEEMELSGDRLSEQVKFLKENMVLTIAICEGAIVNIDLPNFAELKVQETEPGVRSDTVKVTTKAAILETGARVSVPLFINNGDIVKIDTRTGEYISRV